jgi:ABC-type multidrug transport system fused ATPase/permease subunit
MVFCRYSWQLTLVILSVTPVILIVMFLQGTCMKVLTEQELSALAGAGELLCAVKHHKLVRRLKYFLTGSKAAEVLDNIRTVRSFVTEEAEIQNYSDKINVSYFVAKKRCDMKLKNISKYTSFISQLGVNNCVDNEFAGLGFRVASVRCLPWLRMLASCSLSGTSLSYQ